MVSLENKPSDRQLRRDLAAENRALFPQDPVARPILPHEFLHGFRLLRLRRQKPRASRRANHREQQNDYPPSVNQRSRAFGFGLHIQYSRQCSLGNAVSDDQAAESRKTRLLRPGEFVAYSRRMGVSSACT